MDTTTQNRPIQPSRRVWKWAIIATFFLALSAWIYWSEPITALAIPDSDYWNDKANDIISLVSALAAAMVSAKLLNHFERDEPPYRIWRFFSLGWWAWVGGEIAGLVYDYFYWFTDYPEFTLIDVFWLSGYFLFGLSLYHQFRVIYRYKQGGKSYLYFALIAAGLILSLGLTQLALKAGLGEGYSWGALYLSVIYPVFDLVEGAAALWLFFLFGRGFLGRPWWGLLFFALADGLNIFFWMGGYNLVPDSIYYPLDLISNMAYVLGYMITALACLAAHDQIKRSLAVNTDITHK